MTRHFFAIVLTALLMLPALSGCDAAVDSSVSSEVQERAETPSETQAVTFQGISLDIPDDWEYEESAQLTLYPDYNEAKVVRLWDSKSSIN